MIEIINMNENPVESEIWNENQQGLGEPPEDFVSDDIARDLLIPKNIRDTFKDDFESIAQSGFGRFSRKDLKRFIESLGLEIEFKDLQTMFDQADLNGDGVVTEEEFDEFIAEEYLLNAVDHTSPWRFVW